MQNSTLFTLSDQPDSADRLKTRLAITELTDSSLLLRQDACYLLARTDTSAWLKKEIQRSSAKLFVLKDDAIARGILDHCIACGATPIDYPQWVALTLSHQQLQVVQ